MHLHDPTSASDVTHPGGMRAKRAFPTEKQSHLDPFVLFERFHIESSQGFDTHPHYGFEIVSYVLEGGMVHDDSLGHSSTARAGDAMRITTGGGIRHSELPADDGACSGLQLWVNLPRDRKQMEASYQDAASEELPVEDSGGATVKTVVGEGSPLELQTPMEYLDAEVTDSWTWTVPDGWTGFCYAVSGDGRVESKNGDRSGNGDRNGSGDSDEERTDRDSNEGRTDRNEDDRSDDEHADKSIAAGEFFTVGGDASVTVSTDSGVRLVAVSGAPHGEEIRQRGPFVE